MSLKLSRLRRGELLAALAAVALLAAMLAAPWLGGGGGPENGLRALPVLRWLLLAGIAAAISLAVAQAACRAPALPAALSVIATVLAAGATLALAIRLPTAATNPRVSAWLGLTAAAAMAVGAFLSLREEDGWRPGPDRRIEAVRLDPPARAEGVTPRPG